MEANKKMTSQYLQGQKIVETKEEGEFRFNKLHLVTLEDEEIIDVIHTLAEHYDDPEEAYAYGIWFSFEDIVGVDADDFVKGIDTYVEWAENIEKDRDFTDYKKAKTYFEKHAGYSFYFKEKPQQKQGHGSK